VTHHHPPLLDNVLRGGHVVPVKDGPRLQTDHVHNLCFGPTFPLQSPNGRPSEIVNDPAGDAGLLPRQFPGRADTANRLSVSVKHVGNNLAEPLFCRIRFGPQRLQTRQQFGVRVQRERRGLPVLRLLARQSEYFLDQVDLAPFEIQNRLNPPSGVIGHDQDRPQGCVRVTQDGTECGFTKETLSRVVFGEHFDSGDGGNVAVPHAEPERTLDDGELAIDAGIRRGPRFSVLIGLALTAQHILRNQGAGDLARGEASQDRRDMLVDPPFRVFDRIPFLDRVIRPDQFEQRRKRALIGSGGDVRIAGRAAFFNPQLSQRFVVVGGLRGLRALHSVDGRSDPPKRRIFSTVGFGHDVRAGILDRSILKFNDEK